MSQIPSPENSTNPWAAPGGDVVAPQRYSSVVDITTASKPPVALVGSPVSRLQPRTVGQLLDGGFEVMRFRFQWIFTVAATIVLPLYVLPQLLLASTGIYRPEESGGIVTSNPFGVLDSGSSFTAVAVVLSWLSAAGLMFASMMVSVAIVHMVSNWLVGRDPTPKATLQFTASRVPVALGAFLLAALIKIAGMTLCGLGLLWAIPALSVLGPVVGGEPGGAGAAVSRTIKLTARRLGPVIGVSVLWWLASSIVSLGIQQGANTTLSMLLGETYAAALLTQVVNVAATVLLLVVQVSVTVLLYIDLRVRTEGLDLELEAGERFNESR